MQMLHVATVLRMASDEEASSSMVQFQVRDTTTRGFKQI